MQKSNSLFFAALLYAVFFSNQLNAQVENRAPSLYLKYQDHYAGDIILTSIRVPAPSPVNTYYSAMNWNGGHDAGGYCGIQERYDGRVFIFSLWDPISNSNLKVEEAEYASAGTLIDRFGGEGVGLRSLNFDYGWETDTWYTLASRNWTLTDDPANSRFGFWFYDHGKEEWNHMVTMIYPVPNLQFFTSTSSFIEDWLGNGWDARTLQQKDGYKRKISDGSWGQLTTADFWRFYPDVRLINYIDNYDGGSTNDGTDWYFWMTSGGTTTPVTNQGYNDRLYGPLSTPAPNFQIGLVHDFNTNLSGNELISTWNIDKKRTPQFSYHLEIYDNQSLNGTPLLSKEVVMPHLRLDTMDVSQLPDNSSYFLKFYITDIFDNQSAEHIESIIKGTPLSLDIPDEIEVEIFPNPALEEVTINLLNKASYLDVISEKGSILFHQENIQSTKVHIGNWPRGTYVVKADFEGKFFTQKLILE